MARQRLPIKSVKINAKTFVWLIIPTLSKTLNIITIRYFFLEKAGKRIGQNSKDNGGKCGIRNKSEVRNSDNSRVHYCAILQAEIYVIELG